MPIKRVLVCDACGVEVDVDKLKKPHYPFIEPLTIYRYIGSGSNGCGTCESLQLTLCRDCGEKLYQAIIKELPTIQKKAFDTFKGYRIDEFNERKRDAGDR